MEPSMTNSYMMGKTQIKVTIFFVFFVFGIDFGIDKLKFFLIRIYFMEDLVCFYLAFINN